MPWLMSRPRVSGTAKPLAVLITVLAGLEAAVLLEDRLAAAGTAVMAVAVASGARFSVPHSLALATK
jgi:hypothetical protein